MTITLDDIVSGRADLSEAVDTDRARPEPVTPGEILAEEFLRPLGLSLREVASALDVPANRISQIVRGQRAITADTALRLARYLGTTPQLWLNLQSNFELQQAIAREGARIRERVRPRCQAA
jgi:addiction module HigA family antidote